MGGHHDDHSDGEHEHVGDEPFAIEALGISHPFERAQSPGVVVNCREEMEDVKYLDVP